MSNYRKERPIPCKVIVVGDSGVGKTSIINRYLDNFSPEEKATIGASFSNKIKTIEDYKISFDIWDTAGQERFRSVNTIFYKEAYICLLVYDITCSESFQSIKNYWYNTVKENAIPQIIYAVIGNKIDLYAKETVDQNNVKKFCEEINSAFFTTSALEDTSIDFVFDNIGKIFIKSNIFDSIKSNYIDQKKKNKINSSDNNNNKTSLIKCC